MGNANLAQVNWIGKELSAMLLKSTGLPTRNRLDRLANVLGDVVLNRQPEPQVEDVYNEFGVVVGRRLRQRPHKDAGKGYSPERAYVPALKELQRYNFTPPQLRGLFESLGIPFEKVANLLR